MLRRLLTSRFSKQFGSVLANEHCRAVGLLEPLRQQEGDACQRRTVTVSDLELLAG
jgi:hypothetical protein